MTRVADELGTGASFGRARPVSARRAATAAVTGAPTEGVPNPTELPVSVISQNPDNPRDHLRNLDDMTQSVQELGVINSITVASVAAYLEERADRAGELDDGARYVVVDGHRRLEAARRSGLATIKVTVDDARVATDESLLEAAFVANYHRDGMTDLEEANALESLVKFYGSQSKASQRLGLAQSTISSKLSILKASPELQADLAEGRRTAEQVRNLGKLTPQEQRREADARAEKARQRSQPAPPPTQPQAPAQATQGVSPAATAAEQSPSPVPDQREEPAAAPRAPGPRASSRPTVADDVPWDDPQQLLQMTVQRMEPAARRKYTALLLQFNSEETDKAESAVS
ncbi:ParB/RepB/Spo0J family partition protein [Streptomyces sp. NPDC048479]|uniref:ParB/RepB/Spo0J family partition protein n=1 Tax=Streptomyces sp. NPDC048479 TaxID=3154725 RepID=UPI003440B6E5